LLLADNMNRYHGQASMSDNNTEEDGPLAIQHENFDALFSIVSYV
jgi:hypothetical protein